MKKLVLGFLFLSLMACEKTITFNLPVEEPQLVVTAKLFALDSVVAVVSISVPSLSAKKPGYSKDAKVLLFEGETMVSELTVIDAGQIWNGERLYYYTSQYDCKPGLTYTIKASQNGYDNVQGSVVIPTAPPVVKNLTAVERDPTTDPKTDIEFTIEDNGSEDNFYKIELQCGENDFDEYGDGFFTNDLTIEFYDGYSDFIDIVDGEGEYGLRGYLKDRFFNGSSKKIEISAWLPFEKGDCKIVVSSITQETYEYERTVSIAISSDNGPFSEPVSIRSNMSNNKGAITAHYITSVSLP